MPPSTKKRSQRARREVKGKKTPKTTENERSIDIPDSSPSRPAKRRKRGEMAAEMPQSEPEPEPEPELEHTPEPEPEPVKPPKRRSELELTDEELMNIIIPTLTLPPREVQVTQDHANETHEKYSSVSAFAKLAGKGWTYFIKKRKNNIGRPPEGSNAGPKSTVEPEGATQPVLEADEEIDIDLGPNKMVSRKHACIFYDDETEHWTITVFGRNGARLNTKRMEPKFKHLLFSGSIIEVAGVEMMFALPVSSGPLGIDRKYLERAGLLAELEEGDMDDDDDDDEEDDVAAGDEDEDGTSGGPSSLNPATAQASLRSLNGGPLPIAPAPPNYQRPGTPTNAHSKAPFLTGKSPAYAGSTMLMNSEDIDLSIDANAHIKPSYSYAQLISQAILKSKGEMIALNGIYRYITSHYAYYRHQDPKGWQNSIRHNLSLNEAFIKKDRPNNEPGKGMKWVFVDQKRDEMVMNAYKNGRGGHRGSPGTPGTLRIAKEGSSRVAKRTPMSKSPLSKTKSETPTSQQLTPTRESKRPEPLQDDPLGDGSPLPRLHHPQNNVMSIFDNAPGSPPAASSSYLPEESAFVTPAPRKVHPQFGPASTAQRPSQVMQVTSSPAPFWRYVDNDTPMKGNAFGSSPTKGPIASGVPQSSSPAPARARGSSATSPSRNAGSGKPQVPIEEDVEDEEQQFDLAVGFQSIGSFHSAPTNAVAALNART